MENRLCSWPLDNLTTREQLRLRLLPHCNSSERCCYRACETRHANDKGETNTERSRSNLNLTCLVDGQLLQNAYAPDHTRPLGCHATKSIPPSRSRTAGACRRLSRRQPASRGPEPRAQNSTESFIPRCCATRADMIALYSTYVRTCRLPRNGTNAP